MQLCIFYSGAPEDNLGRSWHSGGRELRVSERESDGRAIVDWRGPSSADSREDEECDRRDGRPPGAAESSRRISVREAVSLFYPSHQPVLSLSSLDGILCVAALSCRSLIFRSLFRTERLRAWAFSATNAAHLKQLKQMGIDIQVQSDGRLQLSHHGANVSTFVFINLLYLSARCSFTLFVLNRL